VRDGTDEGKRFSNNYQTYIDGWFSTTDFGK
jgi:hypothetical protein